MEGAADDDADEAAAAATAVYLYFLFLLQAMYSAPLELKPTAGFRSATTPVPVSVDGTL